MLQNIFRVFLKIKIDLIYLSFLHFCYVTTLIKDLQSGAKVISRSFSSTMNNFQILNETSNTKKCGNKKSLKSYFYQENIFLKMSYFLTKKNNFEKNEFFNKKRTAHFFELLISDLRFVWKNASENIVSQHAIKCLVSMFRNGEKTNFTYY